MRVKTGVVAGALCLLLIAAASAAFGKDKENDKGSNQIVDSGSFGVFVQGRRVATETFAIKQDNQGSVITSEFKSAQGMPEAMQTSELELTSDGNIQKYEWKELAPKKITATVTPNDDYLSEHVDTGPGDKPFDQPFLLPASTSILDDYFFIDREVMLWKYLAVGCRQENGELQCPLHQRAQFGTLNPHSRSSAPASIEFAGKEKVMFHGVEQNLDRFDLKSEGQDWSFWLDSKFKLVRIFIADENTEVVRD